MQATPSLRAYIGFEGGLAWLVDAGVILKGPDDKVIGTVGQGAPKPAGRAKPSSSPKSRTPDPKQPTAPNPK